MQKLIKSILFVLIVIIISPSCKKGVDDPFISFRSRKQRIIGKWELVKCKIENNMYDYVDINTTTTILENDILTYIDEGKTYKGTYTYTIEFTKDGKYKKIEKQKLNIEGIDNEVKFVEIGRWNFIHNTDNGTKDQEYLLLQPISTSVNNDRFGQSNSIKNMSGYNIQITKLSNKELEYNYDKHLTELFRAFKESANCCFIKNK